MLSSKNRSNLADTVHTTRLLQKILDLHTQKASRLEFRVPGDRYLASICTLVVIDPTAQTVTYTDPSSVAKTYALADIQIIKRLRNKKFMIAFKS